MGGNGDFFTREKTISTGLLFQSMCAKSHRFESHATLALNALQLVYGSELIVH